MVLIDVLALFRCLPYRFVMRSLRQKKDALRSFVDVREEEKEELSRVVKELEGAYDRYD